MAMRFDAVGEDAFRGLWPFCIYGGCPGPGHGGRRHGVVRNRAGTGDGIRVCKRNAVVAATWPGNAGAGRLISGIRARAGNPRACGWRVTHWACRGGAPWAVMSGFKHEIHVFFHRASGIRSHPFTRYIP